MIKKIIKILLVLLCMFTIFFFSSDDKNASSKKSNQLIDIVTEKLFSNKISKKQRNKIRDKYVTIVRKTAHFTLYFLLGLSFISLLSEYRTIDKNSVIISIIFVLLYACSDEFHQTFINGRSGELRDILIDTLGGLLASILYYLIYNIRRRTNE